MRNSYRIAGNKAYITIPAVNGRIPLPEAEVTIDLKNLNKASEFPGVWRQYIHHTGEIRVNGLYCRNGKRYEPVLSRYIAEPTSKERIIHIDRDTFNCLESNMAKVNNRNFSRDALTPITPPPEPEKRPESTEALKPVKGVSWHKGKRKWEVKPYYQGKRYNLGYWPEYQLAEANEAANYLKENGPEAYNQKYKGRN